MENCASKDTLLRHRTILVQDMNKTQLNQILDAIYSKKIITKEEYYLVKSHQTPQEWARQLLDIIDSKGENTCHRFLKRLKKVNKELWKKVTRQTACRQRGRKRKAECEVQVRPNSDRSTPEAHQPCCDNGGTWECKVSEDTQAGKIRLCLSRHPQCLSSEDSPSHQGQESPGIVSDSSADSLSSASSVCSHSHSNQPRMKSTNFELNIKAQLWKSQSGTRAKKAGCQLKSNLRQYSKSIKRKVTKICDQSFVRVKRVHRGSLLCTVYLETYQALQRFVSRDHTDLCTVLKEAIITPEMEATEGEEVVVSMEVLPSHSQENGYESDASDMENRVPMKKVPVDEAPSCSYTKVGKNPKPPLEMYQPPPTPVETPPPVCSALCGSQQDGECTIPVQELVYPTPEDAWAWLHCVDEFFQKDSTAAMAIRTSWSANQLVKHIIRDRYFHPYLCYYWLEKKLFPNSFSDFVDFLVLTSAKHFCVENGVLPDISFKSKCLQLGEIAFIRQIVHGSKSQPAMAEDVAEFSFGWLQRSRCQNSPTVRSPGHDHSCIYVHDSIRQYLIACWVAEIISDHALPSSMSEHLTSFFEVASSLPVTCYCLASRLGKLQDPEKLFSLFFPLLKEVWIDPKVTDFQRFLLATMIVESKQCTLLTGVLSSLFPHGLLDLTSLPDLSYHNLHALKTVVEETGIIQSLKLPGNVQSESLMGPCPFNSTESVDMHTNKLRCIRYVSLLQCLTIKQRLHFSNIEYIRCNDDNLLELRDFIQFLPELKTLSFRPQTKFDLRPLSYIVPSFVFTPKLSSVILGDSESVSESEIAAITN